MYGQSIRFNEKDVRVMGRCTMGVKGISLRKDDLVVGMDIIDEDKSVLVVTSKGYGKKTPASEYRPQTRGGKGVKTLNVTNKNGNIVGIKVVSDDIDIMLVTTRGMVIRMGMNNISSMGRYTQGVKLINVKADNTVTSVTKIESDEDEE